MILDIKKWQIVIVETASGNAHFERSLASTENIDVFTLRGPQNCVQNPAHNPSLSAAMQKEGKKRLREVAKVQVPAEAFVEMMKIK